MKTLLRSLTAGLCANLLALVAHGQGTLVFNPDNGHYYEAVAVGLSWPAARDDAATRNYLGLPGHLVTIAAPEENSFVFNEVYLAAFFQRNGLADSDWVWLGGFQPPGSLEPAGGWSWVTGEPFDYTNWDSGQPTDAGGNPNGNPQDFLLIWYQARWNDASGPGFGGGIIAGYIVEYEPIPEPSVAGFFALSALAVLLHRKRHAFVG